MKRILSMLLTGCLLTLLGCADAPGKFGKNVSDNESQVTGKYLNELTSAMYIELKDDGTFDYKFGKRSTNGKYVIDGNRVICTPESGKIFEIVIEGKSLIFKDGGRLTRQ